MQRKCEKEIELLHKGILNHAFLSDFIMKRNTLELNGISHCVSCNLFVATSNEALIPNG